MLPRAPRTWLYTHCDKGGLIKRSDTGPNANVRNEALQMALLGSDIKRVKMLLRTVADANEQGGYCGNALQAASWQGDLETAEMVLCNGADVNRKPGCYGNALRAASFRGHKDVTEMLVMNGADVNAAEGPYGTALQALKNSGEDGPEHPNQKCISWLRFIAQGCMCIQWPCAAFASIKC